MLLVELVRDEREEDDEYRTQSSRRRVRALLRHDVLRRIHSFFLTHRQKLQSSLDARGLERGGVKALSYSVFNL